MTDFRDCTVGDFRPGDVTAGDHIVLATFPRARSGRVVVLYLDPEGKTTIVQYDEYQPGKVFA